MSPVGTIENSAVPGQMSPVGTIENSAVPGRISPVGTIENSAVPGQMSPVGTIENSAVPGQMSPVGTIENSAVPGQMPPVGTIENSAVPGQMSPVGTIENSAVPGQMSPVGTIENSAVPGQMSPVGTIENSAVPGQMSPVGTIENSFLYYFGPSIQSYAPVARKIAYSIIFVGVITCYIVVTIRPPLADQEEIDHMFTTINKLQMAANQSDRTPVNTILTFDDFVKAMQLCKEGSDDKYCKIKPPEDILSIEPPVLLKNYRNPCWAVPEDYLEGPPVRCLPYFFLIGAPKAGTTDMYERISRHPQISGMVKKELHWFTRRRYTYKTETKLPQLPYLSNYTDLFKLAVQDIYDNEVDSGYHKKVVGDCSVSTFWDNSYVVKYGALNNRPLARVAQSIHHLNPKTKFLSILRNPVERTYSDFLFFNPFDEKSEEKFHNLVVDGIQFHQTCVKYRSVNDCLDMRPVNQKEVRLWIGLYYYYLQEYFELFPRDQFYIIKLEDYSTDVPKHLTGIFNFLELDPIDDDTLHSVATLDSVANKQTRTVGDMFPETRKLLEDFFRPYNDKLGELLGDQFNYNR